MPDQAAGLRSLFARRRPSLLVVAGSDPCKAAVAVHFAREAATGGRATVLVDGTPGQIAMACETSCRYELAHVLAGDLPLGDVLRPLTPHLLLLPAARALARFGSLTPDEDARLAEAFSTGMTAALAHRGPNETQVDLIVVNAAEAQAARAVEAFGRDARVVVVVSDRPASLRGAYAEVKMLTQQGIENFEIVAPRFDDTATTGVAFSNLAAAARRFLEVELVDGGSVLLSPPGTAVATRNRTNESLPACDVGASDDASSMSSLPLPPSHVEVSHAAVA